ncbi:MAG: nucleotidyltransferase domain-containing protein [Firmicutes bacterium]|nr:nucleotidyltransferase domain-containing protein [Bacillota bacterium]
MINMIDKHKEIVLEILDKYTPDYDVWVFGSRVGGDIKIYSDLDLVFLGTETISINLLANLEYAFQESDLPYRVDIVDWNRISEDFREVILEKYEILKSSSVKTP